MSQSKLRVAVFFGGRSPEHDVSVVTGLQGLSALDQTRFEAFPVYITTDGVWLVGDVLRSKGNYMLSKNNRASCQEVTLDVTADRVGKLLPKKSGFFGTPKPIEFDVALLAFHGAFGEDGQIQGLFEACGIAYTGARTMGTSIFMDKAASKKMMQALDIPTLPYAVLRRAKEGVMLPKDEVETAIKDLDFPMILKPSHMGSSIGVAKVESVEDIRACLPAIFEYDDAAILEPFVQNMVEYNVAVGRVDDEIKTSAVERPKATDELLDFKQKYMSGGGTKGGSKIGGSKDAGAISEGMLSLTREINPDLPDGFEQKIRSWAVTLFDGVDGTGYPRIDYICDSKAGEIWMNEVNPIPGSFGYFLWEASKDNSILFTDLLSNLIDEAIFMRGRRSMPKDPVPMDARLFQRRLN